MNLARLLDEPELIVTLAGEDFGFSEAPLASLAKLQAWVEANTPHPVEAIKPHLEGLSPEDRKYLLGEARREAASWPPVVGTREGYLALTRTAEGQVVTLLHGLRVHRPSTTLDEAEAFFRLLKRAKDERLARSIYRAIFGLGSVDEDAQSPKDETAPSSPSTGA